MPKYVVELTGTFVLVCTIGSVVIPANPLAPLAIGGALTVMVFAGGHVSGAHYNPAVTLGVFMRGKCSSKDVIPLHCRSGCGRRAGLISGDVFTG